MKKSLLLTTALMLSLPTWADDTTPLQLGEQFALRSYTGNAIGQVMADVVKADSLGIVVNSSSICSSLAGGAASGFLSRNSNPESLSMSAMSKPDDAAATVAQLKNKAGIAVLFGGQTPPEENAAMVKALLSELAKANYQGPIFLHLAVFAGKMAEKAALSDPAIASYLGNKPNLYAVTVNADAGKALIHQVGFKDGVQASMKVVHEAPMNATWLSLFKRSLVKRA